MPITSPASKLLAAAGAISLTVYMLVQRRRGPPTPLKPLNTSSAAVRLLRHVGSSLRRSRAALLRGDGQVVAGDALEAHPGLPPDAVVAGVGKSLRCVWWGATSSTATHTSQATLAAAVLHQTLQNFGGLGGPPTAAPPSPAATATATAVADVFEATLRKRPRSTTTTDCWATHGRQHFVGHAASFVAVNAPIRFALPGFPFKFPSNTTGPLPDYGELLALRRLQDFTEQVRAVYAPGAHVSIFSDGRIYADIFHVPDATVLAYRSKLRSLLPSPALSFFSLDDFLPPGADPRRTFMDVFTNEGESTTARIASDPDFAETARGFEGFVRRQTAGVDFPSPAARDDHIRRGSMAMMDRNVAYRAFMATFFGDCIRLSIHPGENKTKFAVTLVGDTNWSTPWHHCTLYDSAASSWRLVDLEEAQRASRRTTPMLHFVA